MVHGPFIPELYQNYTVFGWQPVIEDVTPQLPTSVLEFLDGVASEYFSCDAYELEQMTHIELPWNLARGNLPNDAAATAKIEKTWMKEYYAARGEEN